MKIGRGAGFGKMNKINGYTINNEMSGGCQCGDEIKRGGFGNKQLKGYVIKSIIQIMIYPHLKVN